MLTRIDHVMICVLDLQHGIDAYTRLEFKVYPGGVHLGRWTHNAIAFHEEDYLELMSVRDRQEYLAAALGGGLVEFLSRGGGLR
jgi:Glyoxalase-like domain